MRHERLLADRDLSRPALRRALRALLRQPVISIILPVYNPPLELLGAAIDSVRRQVYGRWELCIADDASTDSAVRPFIARAAASEARINFTFRERNGHIAAASNSALSLATGEWCALLDQDDELAETALAMVALELGSHPDAGLLYSDEDKIDAAGNRTTPFFKPDWNPELFLGQNYINHLGVYRTSLVRELGGFREGFEGSQDYDLALRCVEKLRPEQIRHIPHVLYHWRMIEGSVAAAVNAKPYATLAARRVIADHLQRTAVPAEVVACPEAANAHRVIYPLPEPRPLVSVIIPMRDNVELLKQCVASLSDRTDYAPRELVIVDNGSKEPATHEFLRTLDARVLRDDGPFNFSRLVNRGASVAAGEVLLLLNNDIEAENPDWLREMVSHAVRPQNGAVGARLWFPDGTLQHGGVITGLGGVAGHGFRRFARGHHGYFDSLCLQQNCTAVTAACLAVRKPVFDSLGGFDEEHLAINFNDVDFCLRLVERGFWNVWTPYADLIHHESASRGHHTTPAQRELFMREAGYMQRRWGPQLLHDPFYNPNFSLRWPGFQVGPPRRLSSLPTS